MPETIDMMCTALSFNVLAVLWHPPFYYKNVPEKGVIAFYKECIERLGDEKRKLKVVLYNFPTLTGVELTHKIVEELFNIFPENIMGIKDSGCSFEHALAYIKKFPQLNIYAGSDTHTSELVRNGAAGGIGSLSNFVPNLMSSLYEYGRDDSKPNRNDELAKLDSIIDKYYPFCSMKAIMALQKGEKWNMARPPFVSLTKEQSQELANLIKENKINK